MGKYFVTIAAKNQVIMIATGKLAGPARIRRKAAILAVLAVSVVWTALVCPDSARALDVDEAFLSAREAFQKGDIVRLDRLAPALNDYALYPYVAYWQLRARLKEASTSDIQTFLAQYPDSLVAQRLRADWLKQLGEQAQWDSFEREHEGFALDDQEVGCYWLQARLARGDSAALQEARPLWFQGVPQPDSCGTLFDQLVRGGQLTQEDVWIRLRLALEAGNTTFAKSLMAYLPPAERISPRQLDSVARKPQRYLEKFPLPLEQRGQRELAVFATWRLAQSLPVVAAERLDRYDGLLPPAERSYAWAQVATAGALKHRPEALGWYKLAMDTGLAERQLAWKARTAMRAADWQTALSAIDAMHPDDARHPAWRYWKSRALIALGREAEGRALLAPLSAEHNYYGLLAYEELGAGMAAIPDFSSPTPESVNTIERAPGIQRALKFYELGLRYEGALEWRWTTRGYSDLQLLAAAEVARRSSWYERAIDTAERTEQLHDFTLRFPTPYRDVVRGYTRALDLDEAWVYGLVRQESRFVVDARSTAGAQGLMQLMPATARQAARRLGLPGFKRHHVLSVDTNINLGTYHLRELMDAMDNQAVLASAGYNAGGRRAREWRAEHPLEGAVYVETIPFTETRDYVRKVMSNTMYYARLLGQPFVALKQRLGVVGAGPLGNE